MKFMRAEVSLKTVYRSSISHTLDFSLTCLELFFSSTASLMGGLYGIYRCHKDLPYY